MKMSHSEFLIKTPLGTLKVFEVYVEHDIPRVFACTSLPGQIFLGISVDEEEMADIWLFVPMSSERLNAVRAGHITLRGAILQAEDEWIWLARTPYDDSESCIRKISCKSVDHKYLPDPYVKLNN